MQLCTQQAQRHGDGNGTFNRQAADHRDGAAADGGRSFIPNGSTARSRKGQEHRLDRSTDFHSGGNITQHETTDHSCEQRAGKHEQYAVSHVPNSEPVVQAQKDCLQQR